MKLERRIAKIFCVSLDGHILSQDTFLSGLCQEFCQVSRRRDTQNKILKFVVCANDVHFFPFFWEGGGVGDTFLMGWSAAGQ